MGGTAAVVGLPPALMVGGGFLRCSPASARTPVAEHQATGTLEQTRAANYLTVLRLVAVEARRRDQTILAGAEFAQNRLPCIVPVLTVRSQVIPRAQE